VTHPDTSPQPPHDALASTLKRTEIQHGPSSIPGREIVQVLTQIPVGVGSGWHTHPGEGHMLSTYIVEADQPLSSFTAPEETHD
jgi:hypothetical protein